MNWYYYRVLTAEGQVRRGLIPLNVEYEPSARLALESRLKVTVLSLHAVPTWLVSVVRPSFKFLRTSIRPDDLAAMLRDMAVMSQAGIPIIDAIRSIADVQWAASRGAAQVAGRILSDLHGGASISEAFERQRDIFPETVRSLVAIGDETGTMDRMLMEAVEHLERLNGLKADAKQALIYPAFVFAAIFGAAGFWLYYVIPKLAALFKQLNAKLPAITVTVINFAEVVSEHIVLVLTFLAALAVTIAVLWRTSMRFRRKVYGALHWLPVSRTFARAAGLAFFSEYLSLLVRSGVEIIRSLDVLERATVDLYYRDKVMLARLYVERGDRLSVSMRRVGGFPPLMLRMISVGEDSGSLDRQLSHLAVEFRSRLRRIVDTFSEIIKPVIILVAGALLLVFVVALVLPVYDLIGQALNHRR